MFTKDRSVAVSNPSRIEQVGDTLRIHTAQGHMAIVDVIDFALVEGFAWQSRVQGSTTYFFRRYRDGKKIRREALHRRILGAPDGLMVDHIDHDAANNRRSNLRLATASENTGNRRNARKSGLVGAYQERGTTGYYSRICINGERRHLGSFNTAEEASAAYLSAQEAAGKKTR